MERRSPHDGDEEYPATSVDGDKNRSKTGMMMMMMSIAANVNQATKPKTKIMHKLIYYQTDFFHKKSNF